MSCGAEFTDDYSTRCNHSRFEMSICRFLKYFQEVFDVSKLINIAFRYYVLELADSSFNRCLEIFLSGAWLTPKITRRIYLSS